MGSDQAKVSELRGYITDEIFAALNFHKNSWQRKVFWPLFWLPAHLFAQLAAKVDTDIERFGIPEVARSVLPRFVKDVQVIGAEHIPEEGPLLVASNHPGAYDSVAILSNLPRNDIKIVVSDVQLFHNLRSLNDHAIYTYTGTHGRMTALRSMIREIQNGGSVLVFPSGLVDPDPAFLPDASKELDKWSPSLELVMRKVPEAKILITIVSGVLSPKCLRSPLVRLAKVEWQKRKLAEFIQVMQQLVLSRNLGLIPKITFAKPVTAGDLMANNTYSSLMDAIIDQARQLLPLHTPSSNFDGQS